MSKFIPVAAPSFVGNERKYVLDCLDSTWISSNGEYITRFETTFAEFIGVKHALTCCNGTIALHLALMALDVKPTDEIIVPSLTYVATANAVTYCGAVPVFVDSETETWNIDPNRIEEKITPRTKGIIVVHLYGHPADMDVICEIAKKHHLFVLEDAAEAHGSRYKGQLIGSIGDLATFSFYGNKVITTGEGGMVVTNNDEFASKIRLLKGQGMDPERRYWHPIIGYNYRMTNIAAAIGLAQLEKIEWHINRRREIAALYQKFLSNSPYLQLQTEKSWAWNVFWLNSIILDKRFSLYRDMIITQLSNNGIETRPFFHPLHTLPMYRHISKNYGFPITENLAARGINLPTSALISDEDVSYICNKLIDIIESL